MKIEKQKENFKNHIATFTDYGNIKIVDFKEPETSYYRIRFLFEEDYCRLHISGDLGEQGLLLRLPCKVGDTVLDNDFGKPCIYTITGFSFGTGKGYIDEPISKKEVIYYYSNYSGSITGGFVVSENGKTVFLTKSEVEQKLKEMEND